MHHSFDRWRDLGSRWWPHTAGGHSHRAPATTETMSGANFSATTETSNPALRRHSAVVRPLTPAPTTSTLPLVPIGSMRSMQVPAIVFLPDRCPELIVALG